MALSDEEQRLLEQMEAALAAEDPKRSTPSGTSVRRFIGARGGCGVDSFRLGSSSRILGNHPERACFVICLRRR